MKLKTDFVTNSSSTAYIIRNITLQEKNLVDFAKENHNLLEKFKKMFDWYNDDPKFTKEEYFKSAEENNFIIRPGESKYCVFGDESGTTIGVVFDYILRDGGFSESFEWEFYESLR